MFSPQRDLDFSELEATGEQLIAFWSPTDRTPRSHRRPPRFTRIQLLGAVVGFLGLTTLSGAPVATPQHDVVAPLAALVPPPDTLLPQTAVTNTAEVVERRGGDRTARTGYRVTVQRIPRQAVDASSRWVSPVAPVRITSCFGSRWGRQHEGIDFDGETGDPIRAVGEGVVVQTGSRYTGMGNTVVVDHGKWLTIYAHASRVLVSVGKKVAAGTKIALVGTTGNVTGSHLHLALSNGETLSRALTTLVNPAPWLQARGVRVGTCT